MRTTWIQIGFIIAVFLQVQECAVNELWMIENCLSQFTKVNSYE